MKSGTRIGPYEVNSHLGTGGMGEVWRARDTRLDRDVAIKSLPEHLATDPDRLSRFQREAKVLASLTHSNIGAIYGLEEADGRQYLVLEFVEGELLAERLRRGALPIDEALDVARQICEALEAAHEKGVIHRDLKPGNVMITPAGKVKVLDFGLARTADGPASTMYPHAGSDSPTATSPAGLHSPTIPGAIMGTAGYMSPEQARGKPVDKRSDVFSFGCVLYEMLTGAAPFPGESIADVFGATLHKELDLSRLPSRTPPAVRRLLARCLAKDRNHRLHDAADARLELEAAKAEPFAPASEAGRARWKLPAAVSFAAGAILVAAAALIFRADAPAVRTVTRFAWTDAGMTVDAFQGIAISPDGRQLVYRAIGENARDGLSIRSFDSFEPRTLPGTELGWMPAFSGDGERVAFYAAGFIKVITLATGVVRKVSPIDWGGFSGAAWMPDASLVFAGSTNSFGRIRADSDKLESIEVKGLKHGEFVLAPSSLPGDEAILCGVSDGAAFNIAVFDLRERTLKRIAENAFTPIYSPTGHILYQQGQAGPLMALPFDVERREAAAMPIPVVSDLAVRVSYQVRLFAIAPNGTLAYVPRGGKSQSGALNWVDRSGDETPILEIPYLVDTPRLSHDGRRIAFRAPAPECQIWMHDLERGVTSKVTHEGDNHGLAWSENDARMFFCRLKVPEHWGVVSTLVNGTGEVDAHSPPTIPRGSVSSISPDGEWVLVCGGMQSGAGDVFLVNIRDLSVKPLLNSRHGEGAATFSPDGRYIAFVSEESGRGEVYVQNFPDGDERHQVSTDGGSDPVWSRNGEELFFRSNQKLMVAETALKPSFTARRPRALFETRNTWIGSSGLASFDVSVDGQRFVMLGQGALEGSASVHVVLNWTQELDRMTRKDAK